MKIFTIVLILWGMLQGCYLPRYAYSPAPNNVPVITEKKASKLGAYYSQNLSNHSRGFDAQGAVALTDRWAIQGSYFFRKETNAGNDIRDSSIIKYKRSAFEAAIGYYVPLNQEKKAWFQIFVGGGQGKTRLDDIITLNNPVVSRYFVANLNKLYIQPAFLFTFNERVSLAISSRVSSIVFRNQQTNYSNDELVHYKLDQLNKSILFWEPALVNSIEFEKLQGVRFEYQLGLSTRLNNVPISSRSFNFSAGIFLDLSRLLK